MERCIESLDAAVDLVDWLRGNEWSIEYVREKLGELRDLLVDAGEEARHWSAVLTIEGQEVET